MLDSSIPITQAPGGTLRALVNDVGQRLVTGNKRDQRACLAQRVRMLQLPTGSKVLDFGCGTGLFARPLVELGLRYVGYDIDPAFIAYAKRLRPSLTFVSRLDDASAVGPFDLVLSNCCFHHISDAEIKDSVLPGIAAMMHRTSVFMLIDVLPNEPGASLLRRAHARLEQGGTRRSADHLDRLLAGRFIARAKSTYPSFFLSLTTRLNPIHSNLINYELQLP
jgi:SAM-dependent methyltransferase